MNNFLISFAQNKLKVFAALLALAFICYFSVIKGDFFFDDEQFIQKNEYVLKMNVKKIFTSSVTEGAKLNSNFYRPNQQMMFAFLNKVFGLNPIAFHITSILFHVLNAFLLFLLLSVLLNNTNLSFIGSILFLIHPVQTEAVAYISGFADVFGTSFLFGGMLLLLKYWQGNNIKNLIFCSALLLLALFTKESMVIIAPLCFLLAFYTAFTNKKTPDTKHYISLGVVTALCLFYLYLKFTVFNFSDTNLGLTKETNVYTESLQIRLITFLSIVHEYFKLFLSPFQLYYGKPYTAYDTIFTLKGLIGLISVSLFGYSIYTFKKNPKYALGLGWFFAALIPFTGIIPLNSMFLEHWMYVPIIGLIICTLLIIQLINKQNTQFILSFVGVLILVAFVYKTNKRAADWGDTAKFYLTEIKYNKNVSNFNNLGMYYSGKGNLQKGIYYYQQSIATYDAFAQPHYNLANIYITTKEYDKVENELYQALMIDPNFYQALTAMQSYYTAYNQPQKANAFVALIDRVNKGEKVQVQEIDGICRGK